MRSDSRTRPALKIAGAFAAGICLIKIAPHALPVWIIIAGIPLFSIAAVLSKRYWRIQGNLFLSAAIFLAGALSSQRQIDNYRDNPLQIFAAEEAVIAFHAIALEDAGLFGEGSAVTVKVESYFYDKEYHFLGGKCLLILKEANRPGILFGDILTGEGRLKIIKPPSNPGQYDFSEHNFRRGITTYLECGTIPSIERSDKFSLMRNIIYPLRRDIIRKLEDFIGGGQAEILKGLTLGLRGGFDDKLKSDLRESGLWHLVSLSGMHIAIVSALLAFALTVIRTPYRLKDWLIIAGIIFYILIAETRAPMVRAGLIISLLILARRMGRYTDHWNLLGFAALVILIFNPAELFSAGFQLSFTAAAFIMAGYQNIYGLLGGNKNFVRQKRVMRYLIGLIAASITAAIGTAPLLALYFGKIPFSSIIGGLFAVPLTVFILALTPVFYLAVFVNTHLAAVLGNALWGAAAAFEYIISVTADLPLKLVIPGFDAWTALLFLIPIWLFVNLKRSWLWIMLAAVNIIIWKNLLEPERCLITFLDAGQGCSAIVELPFGKTVIVDTGPLWGGFDAGEDVIIPYLRSQEITEIEAVVLTHDDKDHTGGTESILNYLPVNNLVLGKWENYGFEGEKIIRIESGDWLKTGGALWLFFNPLDSVSDDNDRSIVSLIKYGKQSVLLPGDISSRREIELTAFDGLLEADIMLVPHHGSRYSSCESFLNIVSPEYAVISCGKNNSYGHPAIETLNRLRDSGAQIYRTDLDGAIQFEIYKNQIKNIVTYRR